ncbi:uncharacterized protein LOC110052603 [Orbicella faveolata]|uniref:uncharacterized protein LOC110052603 n=1 Tax=Orbicella faveolata TaxID=48498 RepID=UPI0009E55C11|nr:uncharacterized protein LOC110052603 [Orbicella faveolata]
MAFQSVFTFSVLFLFTYCKAKPENCSVARCKLLPVGKGFASEFRRKASDKGVRLVYLNLKIGNDSYDPLELQDVFLPHRWVWASKITESMLTLPDDYDILSLGLLNYQARSMDVHLEDQPSGCLANLNSTWQSVAVGRMLLENVTTGSSDELPQETQVVCVAVIKSVDSKQLHDIDYHCCGLHKGTNGRSSLCDLRVTVDVKWLRTGFEFIILTWSILVSFYIPALPLLLPDCVFSLRRECDKENRSQSFAPADQQDNNGMADQQNMQAINSGQDASDYIRNGNEQNVEESKIIPVDDASPMTFSTLLLECSRTMPDVGLSFNIKLFFVYLCVFPIFFYLQLGLYSTLKKTYINEGLKKQVSLPSVFPLVGGWTLVTHHGAVYVKVFFISLTFTSVRKVLFLRPKDFILKSQCP